MSRSEVELLDTALGLLGLNGNGLGKAPETRLQSAVDARRLMEMMQIEDNNGGRARMRSIVKGMVDGHPPYDDAARRKEGRGWECNLNFMEGQAIMNRTAVPYYNLFARVDYYAECKTAYQPDNPQYATWNANISRRFDEMLKRWDDFNHEIQQISYWMRLHGIGFFMPENDYSFRGRSIETGAVLVPKGSPSILNHRIPYVVVTIPYRIVELYNFIKDEKTARKKGWNPEAVKLAIKYGMRGQIGVQDWYNQPWEKFERMIKNHDLTASWTDGDLVDCGMILVQEFAKPGKYKGKISKFLFTQFKTVSPDDFQKMPNPDSDKDFLFSDPNCYDSYLEGLIPFFRNTGDGTWHSVRGYAMEAFKHVEVSNRLKCQMINRAFIDSSVVVQHPTERNRKRFELSVWGSVVSLPAQTTIVPTVIQGGTDGVIAVDRVLENHLQSNLGVGAPRSISREDGRGEQPTARHVDYVAANEASIGEGEITIFYQNLDNVYNFMFHRAADTSNSDEEAKRFRDECESDGVPREALEDMCYVRANRQSGYGSPEMGMMKMQQVMPLVPMFPEEGKQKWLQQAVIGIAGPENAKAWTTAQQVPNDQDWEANVENGQMDQGQMPIISSGQDDVIHLQSHFAHAQQKLAPIGQAIAQQQQDPTGQNDQPVADPQTLQENTIFAQTLAPHVQQHIARLEQDPMRKQEAKLFSDQFKQLAEFGGVLWGELRKAHRALAIQAQQSQQATALSALDQAKIQSVQTQAQAAAMKAQSQIQNQQAKTLQGMRLKDLQTAHKLHIENIDTAHTINLDRVKTASEIQTDRLRSLPEDVQT